MKTMKATTTKLGRSSTAGCCAQTLTRWTTTTTPKEAAAKRTAGAKALDDPPAGEHYLPPNVPKGYGFVFVPGYGFVSPEEQRAGASGACTAQSGTLWPRPTWARIETIERSLCASAALRRQVRLTMLSLSSSRDGRVTHEQQGAAVHGWAGTVQCGARRTSAAQKGGSGSDALAAKLVQVGAGEPSAVVARATRKRAAAAR